jgi:RNAse (barnase) inhibitor barstar
MLEAEWKVTRIDLDGSRWKNSADFYEALLTALGAPSWHGRNLDALSDTLRGDDINQVRLPFAIHIHGLSTMGPDARSIVTRFAELISDSKAEGAAADLVLE